MRTPSRTSLRDALARGLAVAATALLLAPPALAADPPRLGDDPVLIELGATRERVSFVLERFEIAVRGVVANQGMAYDASMFVQFYQFLPSFLEQRAMELVLMAQAAARGIEVSEDDVDTTVARVRANFGDDDEAFAEALTGAGFRDEAQFRALVRESELVQRTVVAIREGVVITDTEVAIAYAGQRQRFVAPAEACARHILVPEEEAAEALIAALDEGADFAELAEAESIDSGSAVRGGDIGCITPGRTVAPFDEAAFGAELDTVVGPVATQFGFHLILVYEHRPERQLPLDEVRDQLESELRAERAEVTLDAIVAASGVQVYPERIPPLEPEDQPADDTDDAESAEDADHTDDGDDGD